MNPYKAAYKIAFLPYSGSAMHDASPTHFEGQPGAGLKSWELLLSMQTHARTLI